LENRTDVDYPKVWEKQLGCIISMYGPTDLLSLVPVWRGILKDFTLSPRTPSILKKALIDPPPTETPPPKSFAEGSDLRALLDVVVVGGGVVWEFLVGGLVGGGVAGEGERG
jgi:hypothetical protein